MNSFTTLVLGLGISGKAVVEVLLQQGDKVIMADDYACMDDIQSYLARGAQWIDVNTDSFPEKVHKVIVSPGIPSKQRFYVEARKKGIPIMGEVGFAFDRLKERHYTWVGITGTNGKTTVTLLVEHLLQVSGYNAMAAGNVGVPLTKLLLEPQMLPDGSIVVVELSSFQLETLQGPLFDVAALLNITEDHLDRYESFDHYVAAKSRLFDCLKTEGTGYVEEKCREKFFKCPTDKNVKSYGYQSSSALYLEGRQIFFNGQKEARYEGQKSHDSENFLAAYAVLRSLGVVPEAIMQAMKTFHKPPHRLEFVEEIQSVRFINDSKGTNVDATMRALEVTEGPIVLIAGGVHKGASYCLWRPLLASKGKALCLIGQASQIIEEDLRGILPIYSCSSLQEAVNLAYWLAGSKGTVLLSPGCASFDMFSNYVERGNQFKNFVRELRGSYESS